ncbi:MAG: DUF1175 family protein [Holophagaceae bacterium]|uniref:DUF1175 family protein n=1 Tax=Candidatus Geothrix skivensis TaxID=2954439 RepID=A0A9D7SEV1_9BACT|nr:DUF1175 family protein [Candidatus Geothrix skivensis]
MIARPSAGGLWQCWSRQLEAQPAWQPRRDCAGLLRLAFREALAGHTATWRQRVAFTIQARAGSLPCLRPGMASRLSDPDGWPAARGLYLRRLACDPAGRDRQQARPGDLIFAQEGGATPSPSTPWPSCGPTWTARP